MKLEVPEEERTKTMNILIQGGRVIDPASQTDSVADVAISEGKILAIGKLPADFQAQKTIDAKGLIVMPGLVDLSVSDSKSQATNTKACSIQNWPRLLPVASPAWCAHPTPTLCWTSLAWSKCCRFKAEKLNRSKGHAFGGADARPQR